MGIHFRINRKIRQIMSKNTITDELIAKELLKLGYDESKFEDEEYIHDLVCNHYDLEITSRWSDNCNFFMYEEQTADGYSVWIATHDQNNISINEDVHYYDADFSNLLVEFVRYGNHGSKVYVDEPSEEWVNDAMYQLFEVIQVELHDQATNNLIDLGYEEK